MRYCKAVKATFLRVEMRCYRFIKVTFLRAWMKYRRGVKSMFLRPKTRNCKTGGVYVLGD